MRNIDKSEKVSIVAAFVHELMNVMNAERCLKISISNFSVFNAVSTPLQNASGFEWAVGLGDTDKFDLILGDLPLGMNREEYQFRDKKLKTRQNWIEILKSIKFLNENG